MHRIVVVGANNIDISAKSHAKLVYGDSNPGKIRTGLGGVGRNIAENLARMGQNVSLITAFGADEFSFLAKQQAEHVGLDLSESLNVKDASSSIYVCVNDANGEMNVAVNDMEVADHLTSEFLATKLAVLNAAEAVVIDANLPEESILFLAEHCTAPIFADAVSAQKAGRLRNALPRLAGIKANRLEVELLCGVKIQCVDDARVAASTLHGIGPRYVFVTLGEQGAFASLDSTMVNAPSYCHDIVNTTGCGDSFLAAIIVGILEKRSCRDVLGLGLAASAITALSDRSVSPNMTFEKLQATLNDNQP